MKNFQFVLIFSLVLSSCSYFKQTVEAKKIVKINSSPLDAEIYSLKGEKIGTTPKTLSEADLKQLQTGDHLNFVIKKGGFVEREIVSSILAVTDIKVNLTPLTNATFNENILYSYSSELNLLTRELLQIQGLIFLNKYSDAMDKLALFQKSFPNVAAAYALMGNIYLSQGKQKEAKEQLLRAQSIDQKDETVARALKNME